MSILILVVSLGVVTLGAELLVRSASAVALRAGVSALFVGLTIVGFGTSSPELSASVFATLEGSSDVAIGNVVGSNIFNIAFILALTATIKPIRVAFSAVRRDLAIAFGASALLLLPLAPGLNGVIPSWLGALMFLGLVGYIAAAYRADRAAGAVQQDLAEREVRSSLSLPQPPAKTFAWHDTTAMHVVLVVVGLGLLILGAKGFVGAAIEIAEGYGVPADVIGLTIVSVGTSLPELVTSIVAARRGNVDIAVGNVIGSNIFNALGITGVAAMIAPQTVSPNMLMVDVPVMLIATIALVPLMKSGNTISRREGLLLLAGYGAYLTYLLVARTG